MSAAFPATVKAAQLVYSNVEAEHSPTGRRGFQVWLCSARLKDQQREIARRLEDFDWPSPDAAKNFVTERFCYFRTTNGEAVVARTVPVTERDALRRAGRFHSHAMILPPDEFAKLGNDPFAVLDHVPFQNGPGPVIETGAWEQGLLPDAQDFAVGPPQEPEPSFLPSLQKNFPQLVRWLDGADDGRPVAMPASPAQVAGFLRAFFRALPPWLRVKATFDTLSTGQSLSQLTYRFAGAYDVASFRDWPYRRAYRLEPASGEFPTPPAVSENPTLDFLSAKWAEDTSLSDADKEGTFLLARVLNDPKAGAIPTEISDDVLRIVQEVPTAGAGFAKLVRDRVSADLPYQLLQPMVNAEASDWIGPFSRESLAKLPNPIPPTKLAAWLTAHVERAGTLTNEEAHQLEKWSWDLLGTPEGQVVQQEAARLYLIAVRFQPNAARRLNELRGKQGWPNLIDGWFCEWFLARCAIRDLLESEVLILQFAESLMLSAPKLPSTALDDATLFLAMADPATIPTAGYRPLAFALAFRHADAEGMIAALGDRTERPLAEWVVNRMVQLGIGERLGLGDLSEDQPGVILEPGPRSDPRTIGPLFDAISQCLTAQYLLLDRAWEIAKNIAPPPQVYPEGRLQKSNEAYDELRWDKLLPELDKLGATDFRQFLTDRLRDKARITRPAAARGEGISLWIGPVIESNGNGPDLFSKLYPTALAVAKKQISRTAERVAAIFCAVRVRST